MTQKLWLDEYVPCFKTICQPISCRETNGEKSYFLHFPKKSDILVPTQTGTVYQSRIYYTNLFFKSFFYGWLHSFSHWHTLKVLWRASCSRTIIWWIVKKSYSAGCDLLLDHLDYMLHVISDLLTYIWRGLHHTRSYKTPKVRNAPEQSYVTLIVIVYPYRTQSIHHFISTPSSLLT